MGEDLPSELLSQCSSYLSSLDTFALKRCSKHLYRSSSIRSLTNPHWFQRHRLNYGDHMARHQLQRLNFQNVHKMSLNHSDFEYFGNDGDHKRVALQQLCRLNAVHISIGNTSGFRADHMLSAMAYLNEHGAITQLSVSR